MMQGPIEIDPAKLEQARADWNASMMARPDKIGPDGKVTAPSAIDVDANGNAYVNRWSKGNAEGSEQDSWFNLSRTDANGNIKSWERAKAWKSVPDFYNQQSMDQYDRISSSIRALQAQGFQNMKDIYENAINNVRRVG